jgi:hypothetical protein
MDKEEVMLEYFFSLFNSVVKIRIRFGNGVDEYEL